MLIDDERISLSRDGDDQESNVEEVIPLEDEEIESTKTILSPTQIQNKKNLILFIIFLGLDILLAILIIWQIVSIFSS